MVEDVSEKKVNDNSDAQTQTAVENQAADNFRDEILVDNKSSDKERDGSSAVTDLQKQSNPSVYENLKEKLANGSAARDLFLPRVDISNKPPENRPSSGEPGSLEDLLKNGTPTTTRPPEAGKPGPNAHPDDRTRCGFDLPDLKIEGHVSNDLPKEVGESADKVAKLLKENASPEELKKAFEEFQKSAEGVDGKAAADRLQEAIYKERMGATYQADYKDGKFSVTDIGAYQTLGRFGYENNGVRFADPTATENPQAKQLADDFAKRLSEGVTREDLQKMMPEMLKKMSELGLVDMQASVLIDQALKNLPGEKFDDHGYPTYNLNGQQGSFWTSTVGGEFLINFKPSPKQVL